MIIELSFVYATHVGVAVTIDIAAGDASHVRVNVARYIAANLDTSAIGLDTATVASYLDGLTDINLQSLHVALNANVDCLLISICVFEFVERLTVNGHYSVCYSDSAAVNDDASAILVDHGLTIVVETAEYDFFHLLIL